MKNPKYMFLTNILLALYLGILTYYLFWHFFQYELLNFGQYAKDEEKAAMEGDFHSKSLVRDSIEYYKIQSGDSEAFTDMKIYILIQNFLKCISFRISLGRPASHIKTFNTVLNLTILTLSILGLFWYIYPIYFLSPTKQDFKSNPELLTPDILDEYDY